MEVIESGAISVTLLQNGGPTQARLGAFENQEFEKCAVVMQRNAPFRIVVGHHQGISSSPFAAHDRLLRALQ